MILNISIRVREVGKAGPELIDFPSLGDRKGPFGIPNNRGDLRVFRKTNVINDPITILAIQRPKRVPIVMPQGGIMSIAYNSFDEWKKKGSETEKLPPNPSGLTRYLDLPKVVAFK